MEATTATPLQRITCAVFGIAGTGTLLFVAIMTTLQHQWASLEPMWWPLLAALGGGLMFLYVGIAGRLPPFMDALRNRNTTKLEAMRQQNLEFMAQHGDEPLSKSVRLRAGRMAFIFAALSGLCWRIPALHWLPWEAFAILAVMMLYFALSGRIPEFIRRRQR